METGWLRAWEWVRVSQPFPALVMLCSYRGTLGRLVQLPCAPQKWGHELRPLGKEVFLAEQVRPVLASWQLSPGSSQLPWHEQCDFDISGKWKGK